MQRREFHQGDSSTSDGSKTIWLVSGTGDGPRLAEALLERGWALLVSVVSEAATRAYRSHPALHFQVGALQEDGDVGRLLERHKPRWVIDATHPFAAVISNRLQRCCQAQGQPLLRLQRDALLAGSSTPINQLEELQGLPISNERLLLAIGSRHLATALRFSPASQHFARVLDTPESLRLALAAGLPAQQLACVRPGLLPEGALERALCRRWRISAVVCRQSGGLTQQIWQSLSEELGLRLILITAPNGAAEQGLPQGAILRQVGEPPERHE